jgi:hypothetical protein
VPAHRHIDTFSRRRVNRDTEGAMSVQDQRKWEASCWNSSKDAEKFLERHVLTLKSRWRASKHTKGLHDEPDHRHID